MSAESFTNAPGGIPPSSSDPADPAAQQVDAAGCEPIWYSRYFVTVTKHDPATHALLGQERTELAEETFIRCLAFVAGLDSDRVVNLERNRMRLLFRRLGEGVPADLALRMVEADARSRYSTRGG